MSPLGAPYDPGKPSTLSDFYDPERAEALHEAAMDRIRSMSDELQTKTGLASLMGLMKDPTYTDPTTGQFNVPTFLQSDKGNQFAQKYPKIAADIAEKAGVFAAAKPSTMSESMKEFMAGQGADISTPAGERKAWLDFMKPEMQTKWKQAQIQKRLDSGTEGALHSVVNNPHAAPEQREAATQALKDLKQQKITTIQGEFEAKENFATKQLKDFFGSGIDTKTGKQNFSEDAKISMSDAMTKGMSIEEYANSQASARGVLGTEGRNYAKRMYGDYLRSQFPALKGEKIGSFLAARKNAYKANLATQTTAQRFAALNNRALDQATKQAGILNEQKDALTKSGSKPRAALNAWYGQVTNDPKFGKFVVALNSYLSEYMKVTSGGALSAQQMTDSARETGKELLSKSDSWESLQGKLDVMTQEMQNTKQSWDNMVTETYGAGANAEPPGAPKPKGDRTVARTGMKDGKKVVQYSDGSIEYAD